MNITIPLWVNAAIAFVSTISGLTMWIRTELQHSRNRRQQTTLSKRERSKLILTAGVGAFLFMIGLGSFFDFALLSANNNEISIEYIVSQLAFWSPFAIIGGIGVAIRNYVLIQKHSRIKNYSN
jgi:uncharacterized membrane protein YfcA